MFPQSPFKKPVSYAVAAIAWFALLLQLAILQDSIFNFLSYFTILSNLLVAISLTIQLVGPNTALGRHFTTIKSKTAIALYIFIVGLVYNLVLRGAWQPTGWQLVADNLLHIIVPVSYVLYWLMFVKKGTLKWNDGIKWTYFPLAYLIYSLIRGHWLNWYPYHFLNVTKLGLSTVLINAGFVMIAFFTVGAILLCLDKKMKHAN